MKEIKILGFIAVLTLLVACENNVNKAADYVCNCNEALVSHIKKLDDYKKENDVNSLAEAQPESERISKEAKACYEKMKDELGEKILLNEDFQEEVLSKVKEQCPDVYEYRNQLSNSN